MDKFNIEMENDNELTNLLWINYLENRDFREISAKKKWNELFDGSVENYSDLKLIGMNSLNRFKEFTIGNEKFCTQLIKKYFKIVKEKYNPLAEKKNEELKYRLLSLVEFTTEDIEIKEPKEFLSLLDVVEDETLDSLIDDNERIKQLLQEVNDWEQDKKTSAEYEKFCTKVLKILFLKKV